MALHCLNNSIAFGVGEHWGWQIPLVLVALADGDHRRDGRRPPFLAVVRSKLAAECAAHLALFTMAALAAAAPAAAQDQPAPPAQPAPPPAPAARTDDRGRGPRGQVRHRRSSESTSACAANVAPYVAGQEVVVRFYRDGKKILARRAKVKPGAPAARRGTSRCRSARSCRAGSPIRVTKPATPTQVQIKAPAQQVLVLPDHVGAGARGDAVRLLQRQLKALGYVPGRRGTVRRAHRPRRARVPQGLGAAAHLDRRPRGVPADRQRRRPLQDPLPRPRQARRGRSLAAGHRADRPRQGPAHLPDELGQAVDAHGARPLTASTPRRRASTPPDVLLQLLHRRLRDPRLLRRARLQRQPRCLRIPNPDAYSVYQWVRIGDRIDVYP